MPSTIWLHQSISVDVFLLLFALDQNWILWAIKRHILHKKTVQSELTLYAVQYWGILKLTLLFVPETA